MSASGEKIKELMVEVTPADMLREAGWRADLHPRNRQGEFVHVLDKLQGALKTGHFVNLKVGNGQTGKYRVTSIESIGRHPDPNQTFVGMVSDKGKVVQAPLSQLTTDNQWTNRTELASKPLSRWGKRLGARMQRNYTTSQWNLLRMHESADEDLEEFFGRGGNAIEFDPHKHPRGRGGKFAHALGGLKEGESLKVKGGSTVTKTASGFSYKDHTGKAHSVPTAAHINRAHVFGKGDTVDQDALDRSKKSERIGQRRKQIGDAIDHSGKVDLSHIPTPQIKDLHHHAQAQRSPTRSDRNRAIDDRIAKEHQKRKVSEGFEDQGTASEVILEGLGTLEEFLERLHPRDRTGKFAKSLERFTKMSGRAAQGWTGAHGSGGMTQEANRLTGIAGRMDVRQLADLDPQHLDALEKAVRGSLGSAHLTGQIKAKIAQARDFQQKHGKPSEMAKQNAKLRKSGSNAW